MEKMLKKIGGKLYECKIVEADGSDYLLKAMKFMGAVGTSYRPNRSRWENNSPVRILEENDEYAHFLSNALSSRPNEIGIAEEGFYDGRKRNSTPMLLKIQTYVVSQFKGKMNDSLVFKVHLIPKNPKQNFNEKKEGNVASFNSIMKNENVEDIAQLQRYDVTGHPHKNITKNKDFVASCDEEKELFMEYFGEEAPVPHFHFFNVDGLDEYAITAKNLMMYVFKLLTCDDSSPLNKYSLGMPFLYLKKNACAAKEYVNGKMFVGNKHIFPDRDMMYFNILEKFKSVLEMTNNESDKAFVKKFELFTEKNLGFNTIIKELVDESKEKVSPILMDCVDKLLIVNFLDKNVIRSNLHKDLSEQLFKMVLETETTLANNIIDYNINLKNTSTKDFISDNDKKEKGKDDKNKGR